MNEPQKQKGNSGLYDGRRSDTEIGILADIDDIFDGIQDLNKEPTEEPMSEIIYSRR